MYRQSNTPVTMSCQNSRKLINNYSYRLHDRIGKGFSSEVYRGLNQKTKEQVAIKVIPKLQGKKMELIEMAEVEIKSLQMMRDNLNILELKHALKTKNSIYIVTELCLKGTLSETLSPVCKFTEANAIRCILQIINGYKSIHSNQIIHRDIKPDNIFVTDKDRLKIGDFGFAIQSADCQQPTRDNMGSPLYMSYEALTRNQYSYKSDIWAIGITFYEMLSGKTPWKSKTEKELKVELELFLFENHIPKGLGERSIDFLRRILVNDVRQRMGPQQLFAFSFSKASSQYNNATSSSENLSKTKLKDVITHHSLQDYNQIQKKTPENVFQLSDISLTMIESYVDQGYSKSIPQRLPKKNEMHMDHSEESTQEHSRELSKINEECQNLVQLKKKPTNSSINHSPNKRSAIRQICTSLSDFEQRIEKPAQSSPKKDRVNSQFKRCISESKDLVQTANSFDELNKVITEPKYNKKLEKQMLYQIQSQVNYFRFLFKLFKKMHDTLRTNDLSIRVFKQNLLFLVYSKIQQIQSLHYLALSPEFLSTFKASTQFSNLMSVLKQYHDRYLKDQEKAMIKPTSMNEGDFLDLLANVMKIIYQNIAKIEGQNDEFFRKKGLVFILEELIQLSRLYILERENNWEHFHLKAQISMVVEKVPRSENLIGIWLECKAQIRKIIIV